MPHTTIASQIADLRRRYDAAGEREQRRGVVSALWSLCLERGHHARAAFSWLRELAVHDDEEFVGYGTYALGRIGERGLAELRRLLSHSRQIVRVKAAYGLGQSGDWSMPSITRVVRLLKADSADDRAAALSALADFAQISEKPGLLVKFRRPILAALDDPDPAVRSWAPGAVIAAFRSPRHFVDYAITRLDAGDGTEQELLSSIAEQLDGLDTRPYLPAILRILRARPDYATWFLAALTHAGPDARELVPFLEPLAEEPSLAGLRAGGALLNIDGRPDVLKKLSRQLPGSPDEIAGILCGIGPAAAPIAPALAKVIDENFDEPDWDLMWALSDALAAIESHAPVAIRALLKSLSHESGRVKGAALRGLEKLGPSARTALPDLRKLRRKVSGATLSRVEAVIRAIERPTN